MLAQHVLPMRRSLGADGAAQMATSLVGEASVSPAGKLSARNISPGSGSDTGRTFQPGKRGRRLRTESWTISEDKALHAATAVADAVLISDHEMALEGVDTNEYMTPEDAKEDIDEEEEFEEDKEKENSESLTSHIKEKEDTEQKVTEPEEEMKTETSSPMVSCENAKPDVAPSGKIAEPVSESESVDGLDKRVYSLRQDPTPLSRSSPKSDTEMPAVESEETNKSVLREPSMSSTDSESTTSRKLDESARESFDTSCDSLRLVLEDEDQDDLNESRLGEIDDDKDAESEESSKPAGIPLSDSMPELSKICEQPADTTGGANLTVPELTPVKDITGKPLVSEPAASKRMDFRSQRTRALETDDSSQDDVQDENVDIEGGDDEEGDMEVHAVNSQLMAHLAKNAPIDNNVVVLATWSVHSEETAGEDDVGELDVTGATCDSAEDGVVQVDADKLRNAMKENNKRTEATDDGNNKTNHADETTDATKDVSLSTFKNKLDDILGHHVAADEIEEDVVSDVREQIDDIVTAVELNESRDEELSRSSEGSPEKDDPDKNGEAEAEREKDDEDDPEKPKKQTDKFEEYLLQGGGENEGVTDKAKNLQKKSDNNKDSENGTSEAEKEATTETTQKSSKKSERQPSDESDRCVYLFRQI